jgi:ligand-binding sensor domain-containing protein
MMRTAILMVLAAIAISACDNTRGNNNSGSSPGKPSGGFTAMQADSASEPGKHIPGMLRDKAGNYWFAIVGNGVCRYDGKSYTRLTTMDGLANDFVRSILEDNDGNLWFGSDAAGVCRYDGRSFVNYTDNNSGHRDNSSALCGIKDKKGTLWFGTGGGAYRYNGKAFDYMALPLDEADKARQDQAGFNLFPYEVYCMLADTKGNLWFGTAARGVCCYNGIFFTWYRDKSLNRTAVRCIFEDKDGTLWFGCNGTGVFRYDGKSLTNFTEEKGLGNSDFINNINAAGKPGTLARIWTIAEDKTGNIWFGTIDAGAWRYDGKTLTNFTMKDGLTSNVIETIVKDKDGTLWFGTDGGGVCKFGG